MTTLFIGDVNQINLLTYGCSMLPGLLGIGLFPEIRIVQKGLFKCWDI